MQTNNDSLTGIERELVLQYLIDGNTPVTLTPILFSDKTEEIKSVPSKVFPIALKGEHLKVQKNGKIILENPPQSVISFENITVKVEFYFNRIGLYFTSVVKKEKNSLVLELPKTLQRIKEVEEEVDYDFSGILYFEYKNKKDVNIKCIPWKEEELFTKPVWKTIPLENQQLAKEYLNSFVNQAKIEKNAGNGIQLIPICHYLTFTQTKLTDLKDRVKPIQILYVDHERIVLGLENEGDNYLQGSEYGLKMSFSIKNSPILSRDVFVSLIINKVYSVDSSCKKCLDCLYTSIQEEDIRYLYEKVTKTHFV